MHAPPRVYLDNAATTFPKPPEVADAVARFLRESGGSAVCGAYPDAGKAAAILPASRAN